ncbi:hypothetical protein [Pseudomonas knackmussii]|uniref:hypothetical protein n=1 Tax=Pseudomonas knackmussii TaxID=65741 RepID=UPI003F49B4A7
MPDDIFGWVFFLVAPWGVLLLMLAAVFEPAKKEQAPYLVISDPEGKLRAMAVLCLAVAIACAQAEQVKAGSEGSASE